MSPFLNTHQVQFPGPDEPLRGDDKLLVYAYTPRSSAALQRGCVIVYKTPHDPERVGVKRVVGVAGDEVTTLKGYAGKEEAQKLIVPFGHVWVEGDVGDREKSMDSNWFGPLPLGLVVGRVVAVIGPWFGRWNAVRAEDWAGIGNRLTKDAIRVYDADEEAWHVAAEQGQFKRKLEELREGEEKGIFYNAQNFKRLGDLKAIALTELERDDVKTKDDAQVLLNELERVKDTILQKAQQAKPAEEPAKEHQKYSPELTGMLRPRR